MLILKKAFQEASVVEIKNSTELKEFLIYQNPTALAFYKEQLSVLTPNLRICSIGSGLRIERVEEKRYDKK